MHVGEKKPGQAGTRGQAGNGSQPRTARQANAETRSQSRGKAQRGLARVRYGTGHKGNTVRIETISFIESTGLVLEAISTDEGVDLGWFVGKISVKADGAKVHEGKRYQYLPIAVRAYKALEGSK